MPKTYNALEFNTDHIDITVVDFARVAEVPAPATPSEPVAVDVDDVRYVLTIQLPGHDARPVLAGEVVPDSQGDTFRVESADQRSADGKPVMVGHWLTLVGRPAPEGHNDDRIAPDAWLFPHLEFAAENL